MDFDKTIIAICGATAAGKTDFAIKQALKYDTSVISADSRQCFKELNIGVAKPSSHQLETTRHYFINSHSIFDNVNAGVFQNYALNAATEIFSERDFLVMAGGTGLYVKAFLEGIDDIPGVNTKIEQEIKSNFELFGIEWLQQEIRKSDPRFFREGEMRNPQRMMRALAVVFSTGKSGNCSLTNSAYS